MVSSMTKLHVLRLRGIFLTYIARGDASVPLDILVKTVRTDLRKGHVSPADLRGILDEVRLTGVEAFKERASYSERQRRLEALTGALSQMLAEGSA